MSTVMRDKLVPLSQEGRDNMKAVKDMAEELWQFFDDLTQTREMSLAKTKIEEAVMWASKGISISDEGEG